MVTPSRLVTVSAYGPSGSSARVRVFDWLRYLNIPSERHDYLGRSANPLPALARMPGKVLAAERDLRHLVGTVRDANLILSREASPLSFGRLEERLLTRAARSIYDFDDALYAGYPNSLLGRARHIDWVWSRSVNSADIVIAGSEILASRAEEHSRNVVVVPSCIEPDDYLVKRSYSIQNYPRAVWLGSPSTEDYLSLISAPLVALHRELGLRLTVISAGHRSHGELDVMIDREDWAPTTAATALIAADVGIMPLPDDEWARGKCAYKLLQYAAAGLPTIGSAVGANIPVLRQLGGVAVETASEWRDALHDLLTSSDVNRSQLGRAARAGVATNYSYRSWSDRWRAATGL